MGGGEGSDRGSYFRCVASQFFWYAKGTTLSVLYLHFPKWKELDEEKCNSFRKTGKPGLAWLKDSYAPGFYTPKHPNFNPKYIF